jgi:hypothetical protein
MSITLTSPTNLPFLQNVYNQSFPIAEQRPWLQIVSPSKLSGPNLKQINFYDQPIGLITTWQFDEFTYIEHLAIAKNHQCKGHGGRILDIQAQKSVKPLLVEVEPATLSPEAARRVEFYRRHGFEVIDISYIQPPYAPGLPTIALWLMATAWFPPVETSSILHRHVYNLKSPTLRNIWRGVSDTNSGHIGR